MEVDTLKNPVNFSLRKRKKNPSSHILIGTAIGAVERRHDSDVENQAKKLCVQDTFTLKPASLHFVRTRSNVSQGEDHTPLYCPLQVGASAQRKRRIEYTDDDFEPHPPGKTAKVIKSSNENHRSLNDHEEISNMLEGLSLNDNDSGSSDTGYGAKKIEEELLVFTEKKKELLKSSGGAIFFQFQDVEEFCTKTILDFEKSLQEQYQCDLELKLKEQYTNYVQFRNDNLLNNNTLELESMTLDDNCPDYLC